MPRYIWNGPETNLSRFGVVKKGDPVVLSPKEEAYILEHGHDHLEAFDPKKHGAPVPAKNIVFKPDPKDLPEDFEAMTEAEQNEVLNALEQKEISRKAELAKANEHSGRMALSEMTKAQLQDEVARLRAEGKTVEVQKDASKAALVAAIRQALGQDGRGTGVEETDE